VTLGPQLGVAVSQHLKQIGSKVKVVTFAFNNDLMPMLQSGDVSFTIDQQPYLQGYLSVDSLWLYLRNHSVIGAQQSVPTGPVVVNKDNLGTILPFVNEGLR
jgi:simple sugar transport system substrate-binding protein